jgi:hypothetical protein
MSRICCLITRGGDKACPGSFRSVRDLGQHPGWMVILVWSPGKSFARVAPSLAPSCYKLGPGMMTEQVQHLGQPDPCLMT